MHEWIRPRDSSERWHLELVASASGSRTIFCAFGFFEPGEAIDQRPFEDPPDLEDRCVACDQAYDRIPRIPPRRTRVAAVLAGERQRAFVTESR